MSHLLVFLNITGDLMKLAYFFLNVVDVGYRDNLLSLKFVDLFRSFWIWLLSFRLCIMVDLIEIFLRRTRRTSRKMKGRRRRRLRLTRRCLRKIKTMRLGSIMSLKRILDLDDLLL